MSPKSISAAELKVELHVLALTLVCTPGLTNSQPEAVSANPLFF